MLATSSLTLPALQMLRQLKAVLSSNKTADLSTEQGRSHDRYRRAFLTTLVSGFSKIVTVSTSLISIPLTLHYLGAERYGLWMTIGSVIACLSFSDLGINNGLLNGISKANGTDDRILAQQYVSSAFFFLTAIAALIGLIFALTHIASCFGTPSVVFGPTPSDYFAYPGNVSLRPKICGGRWWITPNWMDRCPRGFDEPVCTYLQPPEEVAEAMTPLLMRSTNAVAELAMQINS